MVAGHLDTAIQPEASPLATQPKGHPVKVKIAQQLRWQNTDESPMDL
jgi:hypothetical protein